MKTNTRVELPFPHHSTSAGRHALGVPVSRLRQEQEMRTKRESRLPTAQCEKRKKKKYGGIMRRVILSDSRSDFIKVIIAERKHSTYKPPTSLPPHVAEIF